MVVFVSKRLVCAAALLLAGMVQQAEADEELCVVEDCQVETDYVSRQHLPFTSSIRCR